MKRAGAVPVIIHLIHRERKTVVAFPSLMFLRKIPYKSVRRQKLRHILLLLLRCLAVALLVGLWLDQTFGTKRILSLVCVVISAPVSLMLSLWVTQRLIARVFAPQSTVAPPSQQKRDIAEDEA